MRIAIVVIVLLSFCRIASADYYVLYDKATGKVADISVRDDAVISSGQEKKVVKNVIEILYPLDFYVFKSGTVSFDAKAFNAAQIADEKAQAEAAKIAEENALIDAWVKKNAYEDLVAEGVVFEKIKASDFSANVEAKK